MKRETFQRYESFSTAINLLPEENQLNAFRFIVNYGINWIEPDKDVDPLAYAIYVVVKLQIDSNNTRRENWCKWWRPKGTRKKDIKTT